MAECEKTGAQVTLEETTTPGVVWCPACGDFLIEETMEQYSGYPKVLPPTTLGKFHRALLDLGWAIVNSLITLLDKHDPQTTVTRSRMEGESQNG